MPSPPQRRRASLSVCSRSAARALAVWLALLLAACAAIGPRLPAPIADVRALPPGAQITLQGVVTVASGTFDAGFALQDASGGIYVASSGGRRLALGDRMQVTGTLTRLNGQTSIEPQSLELLGRSLVPEPLEVTTGHAGTATEGRLIAVGGKIVDGVIDDQPWGWKLYLDDGSGRLLVFVATATGIDTSRWRTGDSLRVTGFSGRYGEHTEVLPRDRSDVAPMPANLR